MLLQGPKAPAASRLLSLTCCCPCWLHHAAAPSPTSSRWSCGEGSRQPPAQQGRSGAAAAVAALAAPYWQPSLSLCQTTMAAPFCTFPPCLYSLALRAPAAPCHTSGHNDRSGQCSSRGAERGCRARWATAAVQQGAWAWRYMVAAALCAIHEFGFSGLHNVRNKKKWPWGEPGSVYRAVPSLVCKQQGWRGGACAVSTAVCGLCCR